MKRKLLFLRGLCVLSVICLLGIAGMDETIEKAVGVNVYTSDDGTYEKSCRDGVETKLEWFDEGYQDIGFFAMQKHSKTL